MKHRTHTAEGVESAALWSACGTHRLSLSRRWSEGPELLYIMLNPSKATEADNDPTIERCQRRATALGFGAFTAANLFTFCATDPRDLKAHDAPIAAETDAALSEAVDRANMTLAAWGVHGSYRNRDLDVLQLLGGQPLHVLGLTKHGLPRHPLYVAYAAQPVLWRDDQIASLWRHRGVGC